MKIRSSSYTDSLKVIFSPLFTGLMSSLVLMAGSNTYGEQQTMLENYSTIPFSLPGDIEKILLVDADSDGLDDLLTIGENKISLYFQNHSGSFNFSQSDTSLELSGNAIGWDLSFDYSDSPSLDEQGGESQNRGKQSLSVVALIDGNTLTSWSVVDRQFSEPIIHRSDLGGFLTRGIHRLHFSRDINNDGLDDLIIPGAGTLLLYIRNNDGSYQSAISVQTNIYMRTTLRTSDLLERRVGQTISIPLMKLRDVNGDGNPDLISRTEERIEVFLAEAGGDDQYFSQTPSYILDLTELQERMLDFEFSDIDPSNLTGLLSMTHEEILEDINQDGIDDFLIREGGKISFYAGNDTGMDFSKPRQILKSGGNVLGIFLYDEDEDGLNDLWLWRIESISIGDVFLSLALSSSIKIDAFIYTNNGEQFNRRPSRQISVSLKIPSVISLLSTALGFEEQIENMATDSVIPTAIANIDNISSSKELIALLSDHVDIFLNSIENEKNDVDDLDEEVIREEFLSYLDYSRSKDNYEIDIRRVIDNISFAENKELERLSGVEADYRIALNETVADGALLSTDLNNDSLDDLFIFMERSSSQIRGILLLSKKL